MYAGTINCSVTALHTCRCRHWFHSANDYSSVIIHECDEVYRISSLLWAVTQYEFSWQIAVSLARVDPESVSDNLPSISPFLSSPPAVPGQFKIKEKKITQSCRWNHEISFQAKMTDWPVSMLCEKYVDRPWWCWTVSTQIELSVGPLLVTQRYEMGAWDNEKIPCHSPKLRVHECFRVICHCKSYG